MDGVQGFMYPNEVELQWSVLIVLYPFITGLVAGAFILASLERVFNVQAVRPTYRLALLTALAFHGLTTELPHEVWIAIGLKSRTPAMDTPPLRIVRLSEKPLRAGVEIHVVHGVELRVFSEAKTVADCFKFRSRVGLDVALAALREGWEKRRFTIDELWRFAGICRVATVMRPYLETLVA